LMTLGFICVWCGWKNVALFSRVWPQVPTVRTPPGKS
jgi:anaerobic ribonucleoside-triphosphate reductase